jgi:hypothetical protein
VFFVNFVVEIQGVQAPVCAPFFWLPRMPDIPNTLTIEQFRRRADPRCRSDLSAA